MRDPLKDNAPLWWDEEGPFKILHRLSPVRLSFLLEKVSVAGQHVLDVGCGGGLLTEPLARLGGHVVGIDPLSEAIETAEAHNPGLPITYHVGDLDSFVSDRLFDIVTVFEVIEHVSQPLSFLGSCASLLKPGGFLIGSTLNRTLSSYVAGILLAERVLGWVPKGTHQIEKFITPEELSQLASVQGFFSPCFQGISYDLWTHSWGLSDSLKINYMFSFQKKE